MDFIWSMTLERMGTLGMEFCIVKFFSKNEKVYFLVFLSLQNVIVKKTKLKQKENRRKFSTWVFQIA